MAESTRNLQNKSIIEAVTTLANFKAVNISGRNNNVIINSDIGLFSWDSTSLATPDDITVVKPNQIVLPNSGRWLLVEASPSSSQWTEAGGVLYPSVTSDEVESATTFRIKTADVAEKTFRVKNTNIEKESEMGISSTGEYLVKMTDDPDGTPTTTVPFKIKTDAKSNALTVTSVGALINETEVLGSNFFHIKTVDTFRAFRFEDSTLNQGVTFSMSYGTGFRIDVGDFTTPVIYEVSDGPISAIQLERRSGGLRRNLKLHTTFEPVVTSGQQILTGNIFNTQIEPMVGTIYFFVQFLNSKAQIDCKFDTLSSTVGGSFLQGAITLVKDTASSVNIYYDPVPDGTLKIQNTTGITVTIYLSVILQKFDPGHP